MHQNTRDNIVIRLSRDECACAWPGSCEFSCSLVCARSLSLCCKSIPVSQQQELSLLVPFDSKFRFQLGRFNREPKWCYD